MVVDGVAGPGIGAVRDGGAARTGGAGHIAAWIGDARGRDTACRGVDGARGAFTPAAELVPPQLELRGRTIGVGARVRRRTGEVGLAEDTAGVARSLQDGRRGGLVRRHLRVRQIRWGDGVGDAGANRVAAIEEHRATWRAFGHCPGVPEHHAVSDQGVDDGRLRHVYSAAIAKRAHLVDAHIVQDEEDDVGRLLLVARIRTEAAADRQHQQRCDPAHSATHASTLGTDQISFEFHGSSLKTCRMRQRDDCAQRNPECDVPMSDGAPWRLLGR